MTKTITEHILTQKQYLLDCLFEDEELHNYYNKEINKTWAISNDETKDEIWDDRENFEKEYNTEYPYPYVFLIDNEFIDALGEEFVKEILSLKENNNE